MSPSIAKVKRLAAGLPPRYAYRSQIGRGAAAYVVLADDLEQKKQVAIKILRPEVATLIGEKRFRREIEILSGLQHPNILPFIDHGATQTGSLFLVTPFFTGQTLRARLLKERKLGVADATAIANDVASALDYAHGHSLIHRDVKPANILLSDGRAIVADFGISRATQVEQFAQITSSGVSLGTPEYMSPEQITGEIELDPRTDVYSLGCVVYEMLNGKPPFTGSTSVVFTAHRTQPPRPLRDTRPDIPAGIDDALMKALEKKRGERFLSAGELASAMSAARS